MQTKSKVGVGVHLGLKEKDALQDEGSLHHCRRSMDVSMGRPLCCERMEEETASRVCEGSSSDGPDLLPREVGLIPSACSSNLISDSKISSWFQGCSEGSDSDDESLIEISIPNCDCNGPAESSTFHHNQAADFLLDFLPESAFRQRGLMELLSEIREDDNLIEIDITKGSIKCSGLGTKA